MNHPATGLAATLHDPDGRLAEATARLAAPLRAVFAGIAVNASDGTAQASLNAAREHLGAQVMIHAQGEAIIGRARRDALKLTLKQPHSSLLYCDFDHMLRWVENGTADLERTLATEPQAGMLIVGRGPKSFAAEPRRLQETERLINHTYALMTGRKAELMFAIRRCTRAVAELIVAQATEDTLANDSEWPLLVEQAGFTVAAVESDALYYRTIEEYGAIADTRDGEPLEWIRRIEMAGRDAQVLRRFLKPKAS